MHQLPAELLEEVFSNCCDLSRPTNFRGASGNHVQDSRAATLNGMNELSALAVSHVCTRWREILLFSPKLWSRVEIHGRLEDLTDTQVLSTLSLTKLYLERSKQLPLDIVIEFLDTFPMDHEPICISDSQYEKARALLPMYKLFFAEAHRWRNVSISVYCELFGRRFWDDSPWPDKFPILQHLTIHVYGDGDDGSVGFQTSLRILEAPLLQTLIHVGHDVTIFTEDDAGPLQSLCTASFTGCLHEPTLLLAGPLTDLTLDNINGFTYPGGHTTTSCLAKAVHIIVMERHENWIVSGIFDYLSLSNLTKFSLDAVVLTGSLVAFPCDEFMSLLNRSSRLSVTQLSLISVFMPDRELHSILSLLPSLTHLAVGEATFHSRLQDDEDDEDYLAWLEEVYEQEETPMLSKAFFHSLSHSNSSHPTAFSALLLSNLMELHIGFGNFNRDVQSGFVDMVRSRWDEARFGALKYIRAKAHAIRKDDGILGLDEEVNIEWVTSSTEWRAGLGDWKIAATN
ncbi:hypothetical protein D9758_016024 [Tetrapyrgos nigripes]|uniref:F-box domain-containing protein n=1 Tax=Tetrapyrgos nigripes TaxID=182062 RepID=A0A8H5FNP2_9AGAR|nr:hypothetical protein D9758_016024 [Tetrapyrgos nigripes]